MIYPNFLKKGNNIDVPMPSASASDEIDKARFINAKQKFKNLGFNINLSEHTFLCQKARSAPAEERGAEFNKMLESDSKAILCGAGGEFLVEMLDYIDFDIIKNNPKWIEGFSDPTGILLPITTKYDIATIYGNNFKSFGAEEWDISLQKNIEILTGKTLSENSYELYEGERKERITGLEGYNLTDKVEWKTLDKSSELNIKGRVIAGCLDVISILAGTKYDGMHDFSKRYKKDGNIIIFDNCELSKEALIRELWKLNEMEYFKYTKCVIFGRNGEEKSYIYESMEDCLKDSVLNKLNIPIIYDADISHKGPSLSIINGSIMSLKYKDGKAQIEFELKK